MKKTFARRTASVVLCLSLVMALLTPLAVSAEEVVFSLANYISANSLSAGDELPENTGLVGAGATVTVAAGNTLSVALDGTDNWRGLDLNIAELGILDGDQVLIDVRRPAGVAPNARIVVRQGRINWDQPSWLTSAALNAGDSYSFALGITPAHLVTAVPGDWAAADPETIRVRHAQDDAAVTSNFEITDIRIVRGGEAVSQNTKQTFAGGVLYSLLDDIQVKGLNIGATMDASISDIDVFTSAGDPVITAQANPYGGRSLRFTERKNEWDGIDLLWRELGLNDGVYEIMVVGNIELEGEYDYPEFALAGSSSPWGWLDDAEFTDDDGNFEIIRTFIVEGGEVHSEYAGPIGGNIRVRPPDTRNNFSIYQVVVVPSGTAIPALPAPTVVVPPKDNDPIPPPPDPVPTGAVVIQLTIDSTSATVNNVARTLDAAPFIADGRTMVPFRFIGEEIGASVDWTPASGGNSGIAHFTLGGKTIDLPIGVALSDASGVNMGTPVIVGGRTFVPARFVAESFGAEIAAALPSVTITMQ
ncbi:MAG: copper amine oxidase N-terminal domain-containing protein [Defluviitaleaceae bacterium]|nr:copper amine oxidase N-terminal domain-containing protein [Defluviitaleaceae bacterium]